MTSPKDYKLDINLQDMHGETALHKASFKGDAATVKYLLLNKADSNIKNNYKETPLHYACKYGYKKIIKLLIEYNNQNNNKGG